ncbi:MAG: AAA family ATPase [bacterium]|nr:AAA family ATPase [bacterium]
MDSTVKPIDLIIECIVKSENFVLQGGAGSGKTETLKQVLQFLSKNYPDKKIACITHTNLAVDEIVHRVGNQYTICTIHSFLNSLIKDFKKNIHQVIYEIFKVENMVRLPIESYTDEKTQKKEEHEKYKRIYEKYSTKLFSIKKESASKVHGKREYDLNPEQFNQALNLSISELNNEILELIKQKDYNKIRYNESKFDDFKELSYGHDSLINLSILLFAKFSLLGKIVQDKYDFIFIDEYQDTSEGIVDIFLNKIPDNKKSVIGLFGDSMQAIYEDGIGDVESYVSSGHLKKIIKEDNYRCSQQVIGFINQIRNDKLEQQVAFKVVNDDIESIEDRQGIVKLFYSIYNDKPTAFSGIDLKTNYLNSLNKLIKMAQDDLEDSKCLMLTNKSISAELEFKNLYDVFNSRFSEVNEKIEKDLTRLQLFDLAALCNAFVTAPRNYNFILSELKKSGFAIKSIADKSRISEFFQHIINTNMGLHEALLYSFDKQILKKADKYSEYINRKDLFLAETLTNNFYQNFKTQYSNGNNTFSRISAVLTDITEEEFKDNERIFKKERFYNDLFSNRIKFTEVLNYYSFLNEESSYITMHKTKGSGINNVLVVLDEYFWSKYNFKTIFDPLESDITKKLNNQKLFYVACSRAKRNLTCVKLISSDEEANVNSFFVTAIKVDLTRNLNIEIDD